MFFDGFMPEILTDLILPFLSTEDVKNLRMVNKFLCDLFRTSFTTLKVPCECPYDESIPPTRLERAFAAFPNADALTLFGKSSVRALKDICNSNLPGLTGCIFNLSVEKEDFDMDDVYDVNLVPLQNLRILCLNGSSIKGLPQLPSSLQVLFLKDVDLSAIREDELPQGLRHLYLEWLNELTEIPIHLPSELRTLWIWGCENLDVNAMDMLLDNLPPRLEVLSLSFMDFNKNCILA